MALQLFQPYSRLVLAYALTDSAVAWRCSVCQKLFVLTLDEAMQRQRFTPPEHLVKEFDQHQCCAVLSRRFEIVQMRKAGRDMANRDQDPVEIDQGGRMMPVDPSEPIHTMTEDDIRRHAYFLYERRGGRPGRAEEDWFQAQAEIALKK